MRLAANMISFAMVMSVLGAGPVRAETPDLPRAEIAHAKDYEIVGRCLAESKPDVMVSFVLGDDLSDETFLSTCFESREFSRIHRKGLDSPRLAGAVASSFVQRTDMTRFDALIPQEPASDFAPPIAVTDLSTTDGVSDEQKLAYVRKVNWQRSKRVLADCTARRAPALARELSAVKIDSPQNGPMMVELEDVLAGCSGTSLSPASLIAIRQQLPAIYLRLAVKADPSLRAELS